MGRTSNTAELTLAAAWQLLGEGCYPSSQAVRERIRQGSMTTINQTLQQQFWPAVAKRLQAPDLPSQLSELMQQLWQQALESADESLSAYRLEIDSRIAAEQTARQSAVAELQTAAQRLNEREQYIAVLEDTRKTLEQALASAETEQHQCRRQYTDVVQELREQKVIYAQAEQRWQSQLALERQRAEDDERRLTQLYEDQKSMRERLEKTSRQHIKTYQQRTEQQQTELERAQRELMTVRDQLSALQLTLGERESEIQSLVTGREQLSAQLTVLGNERDTAETKCRTLEQRFNEQQRHLEHTRLALAKATTENRVLTRHLEMLTRQLGEKPKTA